MTRGARRGQSVGWLGMLAAAALLALVATPTAAASEPTTDKDAEIEALRQRVEALEERLKALEAEGSEGEPISPAESPDASGADLDELGRRLEILAAEIETMRLGKAAVVAGEGEYGLGPAASKIYATPEGLSIGGYGEALYSDPDSGKKAELDFLRAVFYFGYKFNDRWLFNSEIELEHASTDKSGSASVEFAYLDYLRSPKLNARFGLVLVPMGFVNELHEPPVFLGARRPDVERVLIPTTWRETGAGIFGDVGRFAYRAYVLNGLDASGFSAEGLRGGRQKGSKAKAEDFALVGRLDYVGTPGLLAGISLYQGDSGQGVEGQNGRVIDAATTIWDAHVEWKRRGFELRGLVARGRVGDTAALNRALGLEGTASVGKELEGWYLQAGYDLSAVIDGLDRSLVPYVRREAYNTQAKVPTGFAASPANDVESWTLGLAYKPIDQLIFKADFQDYDNSAGTAADRFNLAMGYLF